MIIYIKMDIVISTVSQSPKKTFWLHILNPKIFTISFFVWVILICQDFYAYIFDWSFFINDKSFYLTKWLITLLLVYSLFLSLNFLINLPTFKHLFHKKIFLIVLIIWSVMNLSCYQLLFFVIFYLIFYVLYIHIISFLLRFFEVFYYFPCF